MSHPAATWQPADDPPAGEPGPEEEAGWFAARWGRLLATLVGVGLLGVAAVAPWSEVSLSVLGVRSDALVNQDSEARLGVTGIGAWGYAFLVVVVPVVLLVGAAVLLPRRWARGAVAVAGLALAVLSTVLVGAAHRLSSGADEAAGRWAEVVRRTGTLLDEGYGSIWFGYDTSGLTLGVLGVAVLAMVLVATWWPGSGRFAVAGAATLATLAGVLFPWVTVYGLTAAEVERRNVWWPTFGATAVLLVLGTVVLAGLVWWAALRRSTRGRLALLLVSLPLAAALSLLQDVLPLDPEQWQDAAERSRHLAVTHDVRSAAELMQLAALLFLVAAVLAWSAARRRARVDTGAEDAAAAAGSPPAGPARAGGPTPVGPPASGQDDSVWAPPRPRPDTGAPGPVPPTDPIR
ncbi:hypothetical protein GA0070616_1806 [Micromonospora nigra]|uniref:Uncharacterized protein n=1 Tax=Micromonospora nigra TaxID=145857 RepID=A0A1C6RR70_9ACTN|nr:hypothetical protein [Micromonospora nigra]SCL19710.1 hypothetical protein GA0070616_1806 [Micromonospora nigra]